MTKDEFNTIFRSYARAHLSPTKDDQNFIENVYASFEKILTPNCLRVGSYSRYTVIKPLRDLDILWILGEWNLDSHTPMEALEALALKIENEYVNPTSYEIEVSPQTHSVTVKYLDSSKKKVFSVDVVPAYISESNEFHEDMYMIPELSRKKHSERLQYYQALQKDKIEMSWILSDPRGYIRVAEDLNKKNSDFRKSVKFAKAWKNSLEDVDEMLKLKSFHIEQVITQYFLDDETIGIFNAVFKFFCEIPDIVATPKIPDRADNSVLIDQYLDDLTTEQKQKIEQARDCFLIKLEEFDESSSVSSLIEICFYKRPKQLTERFLFDYQIPTFIDDNLNFSIDGFLKRKNGFREYKYAISLSGGLVDKDNYIRFEIVTPKIQVDLYKWKVRNENECPEPRGEITDHKTKHYQEYTKYTGDHYVECYAIKDNVCVAKSKQVVIIN